MSAVSRFDQADPHATRLAAIGGDRYQQHRVVYADTDAMGVVYHGRYLEIAERSRTEYVARIGIDARDIERDHGILFLVNRVQADYRIPLLLHQVADVATSVLKSGASQIWWRTHIAIDGQLAANIDVATACFRKSTREVVPMPDCVARRISLLTE